MPSEQEKAHFSNTIYDIVESKQLSHFEAMLWHCHEIDLEVEVAATLVSPRLKDLIATEVDALHMLTKTAKLPV